MGVCPRALKAAQPSLNDPSVNVEFKDCVRAAHTAKRDTPLRVCFRVTARHFAAHAAQNSEVLPPVEKFACLQTRQATSYVSNWVDSSCGSSRSQPVHCLVS